ncbi:MAG: T9SS type A sorting domain-containing protein [Bacteroidetes bacterium]|mgnify:CR=1 FL=1|jgi:hypothetical protein|nr:T9SS type A sorting domain-containing protein [Bacteroidota bacterium]
MQTKCEEEHYVHKVAESPKRETLRARKLVNDIWLYLYRNTADSVDSNMVYTLQALAASCPFVEGLAVYRARTLWNLWEPNAVFDDRLLCLQGISKNQDNLITDIDSLIENQVKMQVRQITNQEDKNNKIHTRTVNTTNDLRIYPNPASDNITIEYNEKAIGDVILQNSLGQTILQTQLGRGNRKVQIQLKDVSPGIYYYIIKFGSKQVQEKLNILQ